MIRRSPILPIAGLLAVALTALAQGSPARQNTPSPQRGPASRPSGRPSADAAASITVSPQAGTPDASPSTQISLLGVAAAKLGSVTVVGSSSGNHTGHLVPYTGGQGGSFLADRGFAGGEDVHVRVEPSAGGPPPILDYHFTIARAARTPAAPRQAPSAPPPKGSGRIRESYVSRATLHPPHLTFSRNDPGTSDGDVFVAPLLTAPSGGQKLAQRGTMILDRLGRIVWFHPLRGQDAAMNFRPQIYQGAPVLTWWQGHVNPLGFGEGEDVIFDSAYRRVARVTGGNGYRPDLHEFVITPQGTAWFTVYSPVLTDLRTVGGPASGAVLDSIVQEVDLKTGLVMFEWHSLGHIPLRDSYAKVVKNGTLDFAHINSIQIEGEKMILSARNTWAVYEVSLRSGNVVWRLGGKRSSFHMGPGVGFAYQHDARLAADGTLTTFDNEASPVVHQRSRALVIRLDPAARTATLLHQYTHTSLLAGSQGSAQLLSNGDTFVGWGSEPFFSEYNAAGQLLFDGRFPHPFQSYRAFRFPWTGRPTIRPALAARREPNGRLAVYASWNGSTDVASWQVLTGPDPAALSPVGKAPRGNFETTMRVQSSQPFVAVRALDASGQELSRSKAIRP